MINGRRFGRWTASPVDTGGPLLNDGDVNVAAVFDLVNFANDDRDRRQLLL